MLTEFSDLLEFRARIKENQKYSLDRCPRNCLIPAAFMTPFRIMKAIQAVKTAKHLPTLAAYGNAIRMQSHNVVPDARHNTPSTDTQAILKNNSYRRDIIVPIMGLESSEAEVVFGCGSRVFLPRYAALCRA